MAVSLPPELLYRIKSFTRNIFYSGRLGTISSSELRSILFINTFSVLSFLPLSIFGIINITSGKTILGFLEVGLGIASLVVLISLRTTRGISFSKHAFLFIHLLTMIVLFISGGIERTGIYWLFTFPITAYFLAGRKYGTIWIFFFYVLALLCGLISLLGVMKLPYTFIEFRQLSVCFLIVVGAIYLYETARENAENNYIEKKRLLLQAEKIAHIGSFEWDIPKNRVFLSDGLYEIFGVNHVEFNSTFGGFLDVFHPDDRKMAEVIIKKALFDKQPFEFSHRIKQPDGGVRIMYSRGNVICNSEGEVVKMVGTGNDITDRKNAETETGLARKEMMEVMDGLSVAVMRLDQQGNILLINKRGRSLLGVTNDHLGYGNFLDGKWWAVNPDVHMRIKTNFGKSVNGEKIYYEEKVVLLGKSIDLGIIFTPVLDEEKKNYFVIVELTELNSSYQPHMLM